jgi:hypothetical protein
MKTKLFPFIIALSALSVSASAALYSVIGLSKLFAGASMEVMVMAGSLEFAKLVVASVLYQYWEETNKLIKGYLMIALVVLITITSGGIYGFLSGAYQETSTQSDLMDENLSVLTTKQNRFIERSNEEKANVRYYTEALSNPTQIQYVDKESGQLVTTTSSRQRKLMVSQLDEAKTNRNMLEDSISKYDILILEMQAGNEGARELGPLKYMAELINKPMDVVINWFMLLIIFVFDPLAIILVVIANMAFNKARKPEDIEDHFKARNKVLEEKTSVPEPEIKLDTEAMIAKNEAILATPINDLYNEKDKKIEVLEKKLNTLVNILDTVTTTDVSEVTKIK